MGAPYDNEARAVYPSAREELLARGVERIKREAEKRIAALEQENEALREEATTGRITICDARDRAEERATALEQENATLRADNLSLVNDLEKEGHRLASLRLELETLKVRHRHALTECELLRRDLAGAVRTGESLALQAHLAATLLKPIQEHHQEGESALDTLVRCLGEREEQAETMTELRLALHTAYESEREHRRIAGERGLRLSRLDAFLSSEEVPEGLTALYRCRAFGDAGAKGIADVAWRWFREALGEKTLKPLDEVLNGPALERIMDPRSTAIVADAAALEVLSDHLGREVEKRHSISDVFRGPAEEAARAVAPLFSPEVWRHIVERYLSPPPAAEGVQVVARDSADQPLADMMEVMLEKGREFKAREAEAEEAVLRAVFPEATDAESDNAKKGHAAALSEQEEAFHDEWLMLVKNHETVNMTVLALIAAKRTGLI